MVLSVASTVGCLPIERGEVSMRSGSARRRGAGRPSSVALPMTVADIVGAVMTTSAPALIIGALLTTIASMLAVAVALSAPSLASI
jgi:hypothetical protein